MVEAIYQDLQQEKFNIAVFTPSRIDYNYQYLFAQYASQNRDHHQGGFRYRWGRANAKLGGVLAGFTRWADSQYNLLACACPDRPDRGGLPHDSMADRHRRELCGWIIQPTDTSRRGRLMGSRHDRNGRLFHHQQWEGGSFFRNRSPRPIQGCVVCRRWPKCLQVQHLDQPT